MTEINLWFVPYFFCFYEDRRLAFSRMILLFMSRIKKAKKPFTTDTLPNSFVTLSKETTRDKGQSSRQTQHSLFTSQSSVKQFT